MTRADCQRCREQMDDWLNSELSVETTQEILKHVDVCDECRAELERRQMVRRLLQRRLEPTASSTLRTRVAEALAAAPVAPAAGEALEGPAHERPTVTETPKRQQSGSVSATKSGSRLGIPWWRPGAIGLALTVLVVLAVTWALREERVSAAELLSKSSAVERGFLERPTIALHRSFSFEERILPSGTIVARRRIEVWRNGRTGLTARRAFDERDRLVGGEWLRDDGAATVYRPDALPVSTASTRADARTKALLAGGDLWRMDLSVAQFLSIAPDAGSAEVTRTGADYEITYQRKSPDEAGVSAATLAIQRHDLRPVRASVVVARSTDTREYRFSERAFEPAPVETVAAAIFEPDRQLTPLPAIPPPTASYLPPVRAPRPHMFSAPSDVDPALEVKVLYALHRVNADIRERPAVTRKDGLLIVDAAVPTAQRRDELTAALASLSRDPAVRIDITVEPSEAAPADAAATDTFAAAQLVRRYFTDYIARRLPPERQSSPEVIRSVADATERLAIRVRERSAGARQHTEALQALIERFGTITPSGLSPNTTATWQTMLRDHARAIKHETEALRLELQPIFFATIVNESHGSADAGNSAELATVTRRLVDLARFHDEAVQAAFVSGPEISSTLVVEKDAFWSSLLDLEHTAAEFERPWSVGR